MIRAIHPFGPQPGRYESWSMSDVRRTFARERARLAMVEAQRLAEEQDEPVQVDASTLHPALADLIDFDARR